MQQSINTQKSKKTMSTRVVAQIGILAAIFEYKMWDFVVFCEFV